MKRFGAVDYGRRRIGLAVADPLGLTVRGLDTLHYDGDPEAAARTVAERLQAELVGTLLVGLPLHTSGEESEMSREVRRFGALLEAAVGLAIEYVDEGLTSWEAEETLKGRGRRLKDARRRGDVDKEAACALLRGWLRDREAGG